MILFDVNVPIAPSRVGGFEVRDSAVGTESKFAQYSWLALVDLSALTATQSHGGRSCRLGRN